MRQCLAFALLAACAVARPTSARADWTQNLFSSLSHRHRQTARHSDAVEWVAAMLARRLELTAREQRLVRQVARLHDLGKGRVPWSILEKAGPLTDEEWAVMKQHPDLGAQLLERGGGHRTTLRHYLAQGVRGHHQWVDGGGYPAREPGTPMTCEAQIVAVADFVAAVAERRPYKEPWDRARIVAALREGSGTHFAPDVVEAAVALLEGHRSMMRRLGGGSPRITPTPRKISHALGGKRRGGSGELVQHRRRVASSSHGQGGSHSRLRLGHPGL